MRRTVYTLSVFKFDFRYKFVYFDTGIVLKGVYTVLEALREPPISSVHQGLSGVIFTSKFLRLRRRLVNLVGTFIVQLKIEGTYLALAI